MRETLQNGCKLISRHQGYKHPLSQFIGNLLVAVDANVWNATHRIPQSGPNFKPQTKHTYWLVGWIWKPLTMSYHCYQLTYKWCVHNCALITIHTLSQKRASWPRKMKIPMNRRTGNQSKSIIGFLRLRGGTTTKVIKNVVCTHAEDWNCLSYSTDDKVQHY